MSPARESNDTVPMMHKSEQISMTPAYVHIDNDNETNEYEKISMAPASISTDPENEIHEFEKISMTPARESNDTEHVNEPNEFEKISKAATGKGFSKEKVAEYKAAAAARAPAEEDLVGEAEWALLEQCLDSFCLAANPGKIADYILEPEQREQILDEHAEKGMAATQNCFITSEGNMTIYRHFHRLRRALRRRIADMAPG